MSKIRILHTTHAWLKTTENWIARLIGETPDCDMAVLTREILATAPSTYGIKCMQWPLAPLPETRSSMQTRLWRLTTTLLAPLERFVLYSILKGKYDLVHSHFSMIGWDSMPLVKALNVPHIVSFYGFDYEFLPYTDKRWVKRYKKLFRETDLFLCEGSFGASILERMGCQKEKIRVARLGVNVHSIAFEREPPGRKTGGFRLIQIASLFHKKGHFDALEAFAIAARSVPDLHLSFVGGSSAYKGEDLLDRAEQLGVGSKVDWRPTIDFSQLHCELSKYHAFIHPSKYSEQRDCEGGAPIVILDAEAVGLPVISTRHCDIPDEVVDGRTGFLSDEGDVRSIADNIIKLACLPDDQYRAMREAARKHVEENFDSSANGVRLGEIYLELFENTRAARLKS